MGLISKCLYRNPSETARNIHRAYNRLEDKPVIGNGLETAGELLENLTKPHSEIEDEYEL